jgi:hypothetical protein
MKRFVIFALIGPPIGTFALIFIVIPLKAILDDSKIEVGFVQVQAFLALIPLSYVVGIVPAMLTALADLGARNLPMPFRILCVAVAGYLFGFLPSGWPLRGVGISSEWVFGLVGAVAGAICSWLTASRWQRAAQETHSSHRRQPDENGHKPH